MAKLDFNYNDGGRSLYFDAAKVSDCVVRAISIATDTDYKEVYDKSAKFLGYTPRNGVARRDTKKLMAYFGFSWVPLMTIGSGCTAHLAVGEIPMSGRIVCSVSKHITAVIDGVLNDTYDCSRGGSRCVYGYWFIKK